MCQTNGDYLSHESAQGQQEKKSSESYRDGQFTHWLPINFREDDSLSQGFKFSI